MMRRKVISTVVLAAMVSFVSQAAYADHEMDCQPDGVGPLAAGGPTKCLMNSLGTFIEGTSTGSNQIAIMIQNTSICCATTITINDSWITADKTGTDTCTAGSSETYTFSFDISGLAGGVHNGSASIDWVDASGAICGNNPDTINFEVTITAGTCGDGVVNGSETCDVNAFLSSSGCFGSGCRSDCTCCGDGVVNGTEECDDNNVTSGDGCSSTCEGTGACCHHNSAVCVDDTVGNICVNSANHLDEYLGDGSTCATAGSCEIEGACCDLLAGTCSQTTSADCGAPANDVTGQATKSFSSGDRCLDVTCNALEGCCCDNVTGTLTTGFDDDCDGSNETFFINRPACGSTVAGACTLEVGACCNFDGSCSDTTEAACDSSVGLNVVWNKGVSCSDDDFVCETIPTVSEWGLIVMTLLGCTLGTILYGRRRAARTA